MCPCVLQCPTADFEVINERSREREERSDTNCILQSLLFCMHFSCILHALLFNYFCAAIVTVVVVAVLRAGIFQF